MPLSVVFHAEYMRFPQRLTGVVILLAGSLPRARFCSTGPLFFFFNPDGLVKNWFLKKEIESSGDSKTDSQSLHPGPLHSMADVVVTPPTIVSRPIVSLSVITGIGFFSLSRSVGGGGWMFLFFCHSSPGILVPRPGIEPTPSQWKGRVFTT